MHKICELYNGNPRSHELFSLMPISSNLQAWMIKQASLKKISKMKPPFKLILTSIAGFLLFLHCEMCQFPDIVI